jgi:hypothetical protein
VPALAQLRQDQRHYPSHTTRNASLPRNSNAQGWASYGNNDEKMARWLEEAERQREQRR